MPPCKLIREHANPVATTFNPKVAGSTPARPIRSERTRDGSRLTPAEGEVIRNRMAARDHTTDTKVTGYDFAPSELNISAKKPNSKVPVAR
jgi:hypothetical protein